MASLLAGVAKFGFIPAVALYLLWVLTSSVQGDVRQNTADVRQTNLLLQQHITATSDLQHEVERQLMVISDIQRQQCVNTADDYQKRQACWAAGGTR
jgi:hypothetical protein